MKFQVISTQFMDARTGQAVDLKCVVLRIIEQEIVDPSKEDGTRLVEMLDIRPIEPIYIPGEQPQNVDKQIIATLQLRQTVNRREALFDPWADFSDLAIYMGVRRYPRIGFDFNPIRGEFDTAWLTAFCQRRLEEFLGDKPCRLFTLE